MKCSYCNEKIYHSEIMTCGKTFCSERCLSNFEMNQGRTKKEVNERERAMNETKIKKCNFCGKKIEKENDGLKWRGEIYCTSLCANKEMHARDEKKEKFEEIKRMAEKMIIRTFCLPKPAELKDLSDDIFFKTVVDAAWDVAEKFYDYAKEREHEEVADVLITSHNLKVRMAERAAKQKQEGASDE